MNPAEQETWDEAFEGSEVYKALPQIAKNRWEQAGEEGGWPTLTGAIFAWAYELGYTEALGNVEQAKVYEPVPFVRCDTMHPKEHWQCTRVAGHRGAHEALAPSGWHPDYAVKMDGTPNQEEHR